MLTENAICGSCNQYWMLSTPIFALVSIIFSDPMPTGGLRCVLKPKYSNLTSAAKVRPISLYSQKIDQSIGVLGHSIGRNRPFVTCLGRSPIIQPVFFFRVIPAVGSSPANVARLSSALLRMAFSAHCLEMTSANHDCGKYQHRK